MRKNNTHLSDKSESKATKEIKELIRRNPMQPLRDNIYQTLQQESTYSIKALAQQYRMSEPAIKVQLNRLKAEGKKITIEDDFILLNENSVLWWFAFPVLFITAMILVWWIG